MLKVVFDNILISVEEDDSPIVMSEEVHSPIRGEVVAMGGGTPNHPMQVRTGMTVYFYKADAQKLTVEDSEYFVLNQRDILAYEDD